MDYKMDATLETLRKWSDDPNLFCQETISQPCLRWQSLAFKNLLKKRKLAIRSGHGVGKSNFLARAIYWFLCTRIPTKILITAPTKHQIFDILFPELQKLKKLMIPELAMQIEISGDKVYLKGADNECFAVARTSRKETPEAFQGIHEENVLIIGDEASGINDEVFVTGEGSLSTPNSYCILASNPTRRVGFFADIFLKPSGVSYGSIPWETMKVSSHDSPIVDRNYVKYIEEKYGKDSNTYRIRILGEFPTTDEDTLIPRYLVEEASKRRSVEQADYKDIWGLDVATSRGPNKTVLVKRKGRYAYSIQKFTNMDTVQITGRILKEFKEAQRKPRSICVDWIGPGGAVYDRLSYLNLPVMAILGSEASSFPERNYNLRMDNFDQMYIWFQKIVKIINDEELIEQLCNLYTKYTVSERIRMLTKHEFKTRGLTSPDCADALALTFADEDELEDEEELEFAKENKESYKRRYEGRRESKKSYMAR